MTDASFKVHNGGYVHVPNETINDARLSFKARGILVYMLGRPPEWRFSADRIASESKTDGRRAILNGLTELRTFGYYRVTRVRVGSEFRMLTEVAATPALMPPPPGDGVVQ